MEKEGPTTYGQFLDPALKNFIFVVRAHPKLAYLLYTGMECLIEQGICESSVVCPVGTDPRTVGGSQALVYFLGLEGFLTQVSPHEAKIEFVVVVVHKYSLRTEYYMD